MPSGIYNHKKTKTNIYTPERNEKIRRANLGKTHSKETRQKLSEMNKGKRMSPSTEFKKGQKPWNDGKKLINITDHKHPNWKGDNVSYFGLHAWVRRRLGSANQCSLEDDTCKGMFEWANISGTYKRDFSDWFQLCRSHHRRFDNAKKK